MAGVIALLGAGQAQGADTTPPTVSFTKIPSGGHNTYTITTNGALIHPMTVTFSEPVTGLTASDFYVTGVTVDRVEQGATADEYTVYLYWDTTTTLIEFGLPAGSVQDLAGNDNLANNMSTYDGAPTEIVSVTGGDLSIPRARRKGSPFFLRRDRVN